MQLPARWNAVDEIGLILLIAEISNASSQPVCMPSNDLKLITLMSRVFLILKLIITIRRRRRHSSWARCPVAGTRVGADVDLPRRALGFSGACDASEGTARGVGSIDVRYPLRSVSLAPRCEPLTVPPALTPAALLAPSCDKFKPFNLTSNFDQKRSRASMPLSKLRCKRENVNCFAPEETYGIKKKCQFLHNANCIAKF
jgi:hypothetical protein